MHLHRSPKKESDPHWLCAEIIGESRVTCTKIFYSSLFRGYSLVYDQINKNLNDGRDHDTIQVTDFTPERIVMKVYCWC